MVSTDAGCSVFARRSGSGLGSPAARHCLAGGFLTSSALCVFCDRFRSADDHEAVAGRGLTVERRGAVGSVRSIRAGGEEWR
jgi:hypothetical protein